MAFNPLEQMNKNILCDFLKKIENKLNSDILTFCGAIVDGIDHNIKNVIEDLAKDSDKRDTLYVILTTTGGSLNPVQRMVTVFRHFYKEVNFIVPDYAYSAGTILCMSGDNIFMNYYSVLGPIDPQIMNKDGKLVAALGYLDKINELLQKAKDNTITQAEFLILKDFDLAELRSYEQAKELAIDMLKQWLTKYKFKDWTIHSDSGKPVTDEEKNNRAIDIAKQLSDNNIWKTHNRPINAEILRKQLRLQINDLADDPELDNLINEYYAHLSEYIRIHSFQCFIQTRLIV